ncbi:hypothetical protein L9F63_000921, partial [Diploptera punctata]
YRLRWIRSNIIFRNPTSPNFLVYFAPNILKIKCYNGINITNKRAVRNDSSKNVYIYITMRPDLASQDVETQDDKVKDRSQLMSFESAQKEGEEIENRNGHRTKLWRSLGATLSYLKYFRSPIEQQQYHPRSISIIIDIVLTQSSVALLGILNPS